MKKIVLTYGVISGLVSAALMLATVPFMDQIGFDHGELAGYSAMLLAFLFVFFGVKQFRDRQQGGSITFGRAFAVGLMITLISSLFYVGAWMIVSSTMMPDFGDKYAAYTIDKARRDGKSEAEVQALSNQMAEFQKMYANPLVKAAMTFVEPFPVGLLVTLVSAATLRRKPVTA